MTVDPTDATFAVALILEFAFVLAVAPRITRRLVKRDASAIFDQHMRPGIREELAALLVRLGKMPTAAEVAALLPPVPAVPTAAEVAAQVRDSLIAAQAQAMEGRPDPMEAMRAAMREELDAALVKLEQDQADMAIEDAASVMSARGVDKRLDYAAAEEQFEAALEQVPGALLAVEEMRELRPKTYRKYARRGVQGAQLLARDAATLGIKIPQLNGAPKKAVGLL